MAQFGNAQSGFFSGGTTGGGGGGGVTSISTSAPLSGGTITSTGTIGITQSNTTTDGFLLATDWNTFNDKFDLPSLTSGSVLFSNGTTIAQDNDNFYWDNFSKRLGIKTIPQVTLHVGNAGGDMLFPYEEAVIEKSGDTKFGVYTSANDPMGGGASITLGYTNFKTTTDFYPHFEFQIVGNSNQDNNKIRYNFLLRDASGVVIQNNDDIFDIYGDGRVQFQKLINSTNEIVVSDSLGFIFNPSNVTPFAPFNWEIPTIKLFFDDTTSYLGIKTDTTIGVVELSTSKIDILGANLESATPPTGAVTYLKVSINNLDYLILATRPI